MSPPDGEAIDAPEVELPTTDVTAPRLTSHGDDVSIEVGDQGAKFIGWQTVRITRSCETMPNSFQLTASAQFLDGPNLNALAPGQKCNVLIGGDKVITGWIDRRTLAASGARHDVVVTGRGLTRNLVDCSADIWKTPGVEGGNISAPNPLDLAERVAKPFKEVKVRWGDGVFDGTAIPVFQIGIGETPYQVIEQVTRYCALLLYEDADGFLVLDRLGTKEHASGFTMPGNIEEISSERSVDGRYTDYLAVWTTAGTFDQFYLKKNLRAIRSDEDLRKTEPYRPLIWVMAQVTQDDVEEQDFNGKRQVDWEFGRRYGRSQAVHIVCDGWRDKDGKLWTPNMLAPIDAPGVDVSGGNWAIGTVTFRKDLSGTHADLVLMPPEAFAPEPNPLQLYYAQFLRHAGQPGSPAPPTSNPDDHGPGLTPSQVGGDPPGPLAPPPTLPPLPPAAMPPSFAPAPPVGTTPPLAPIQIPPPPAGRRR